MLRTHRRATRRRGVTIVEFALVCVFCLMLILGVVDFARIFYVNQLVDNAVREGARYAVVHTNDATTTDIQNYVNSLLVGQDLQLNATVSVYKVDPSTGTNLGYWGSAGFGDAIAVRVDGTIQPIAPRLLLLNPSLSIQRTCFMFSEAN